MRSMAEPNCRLMAASTEMLGIFSRNAASAPFITESPIAVTAGAGPGGAVVVGGVVVGAVGAAPGTVVGAGAVAPGVVAGVVVSVTDRKRSPDSMRAG